MSIGGKKLKRKGLAKGKRRAAASLSKARAFVSGKDGKSIANSPARITNETIAKHREEVLAGARRFIYPLRHSKHKIAIISTAIVLIIALLFTAYSWFLLYRQQSTSDFAYRISQIIPFPAAKVDGHYLRFEEYLFELRHNIYFLSNQENVDFSSEENRPKLENLKSQSMQRAINKVIIRQLAKDRGISVSSQEIEEQIDLIRSQGGVGEDSRTLEDTLKDFYGWNLADLKRVIKDQILKQKLIPVLDTKTKNKAEQVLEDIKNGEPFAQAAKRFSEDNFTKNNGGELGYIFRSNTDIPPQLVEKAFSLAEGEVASDLVESLFGYHIVKTIKYRSNDEALIAHILFKFDDFDKKLEEIKQDMDIKTYITLSAPTAGEDIVPNPATDNPNP